MVKRKGDPGLTPNTLAPLMRGLGDSLGVRITASSREGEFPRVSPQIGETARKVKKTMEQIRRTVEVIRALFS
jgi:hypothetical protein